MAFLISDRVLETCSSPGTGAVTLLGAVTGYQSFSGAFSSANGTTTYYCIADQGGANWEVGLGTWNTGNTLTRTTVYSSSNSGSTVNFATGTQNVFCTYPSEKALYQNTNGQAVVPNVGALFTPNASTPSATTGLTWFDNANNALAYYNQYQEIQIGKQVYQLVYNISGSTMTAGQVVYISGAYIGQYPGVALAQANTLSTTYLIGIVQGTINNNTQGVVITNGLATGVNTAAYSVGTNLFVSATTPGALTSTQPSNPNYAVQVGIVAISSSSGQIIIAPQYLGVPATNVVGTIQITQGGTGATTVSGAQTNLQVDPAGTAIAMSIALG